MQQLLNSATANGDSGVISVPSINRGVARLAKVNIAGTANVDLYGRMGPDDPLWIKLGSTFAATGFQSISLPPQVKFTISGLIGATVSAWVDAYPA